MSVINNHSGILEYSHCDQWLTASHAGPTDARDQDELNQIIDDLTKIAEVEAAIHSLCITHLARYGITSWGSGDCAIKFWCNGVDATLHWHVSLNPIDRRDPPLCLISVDMGAENGHVIYGSVVADLCGIGPLLLSQAIISMIIKALKYQGV
jgi:hypothetical protein